ARLDRTPQMDEGLRSRLKERLISLLPPRSRGVPEFHQAWMLWGDKKVFLEQVPEGLTSLDLIRASMFQDGIEVGVYKPAFPGLCIEWRSRARRFRYRHQHLILDRARRRWKPRRVNQTAGFSSWISTAG